MPLSKYDMEQMARDFREDLGVPPEDPLDPFRIALDGVTFIGVSKIEKIDAETLNFLQKDAARQWSAMSVPIDPNQEHWVIVLNDGHEIERQRVSLLEEFWHILQGHRLTAIVKIGESFGRTFEGEEEHDAYYLASATLLPQPAVREAVSSKTSANILAQQFGVSEQLVEYRIKRLGLWNRYRGRKVSLRETNNQ